MQVQDPVAPLGHLRVVRGHHQRAAAGDHIEDPGQHHGPGGRVELGGRLVGDQQLGLEGQRAGDGDALLLAAGQLLDQLVRVRLQAQLGQGGRAVPGAAAAGRPAARSATSTFSAAVSRETRP